MILAAVVWSLVAVRVVVVVGALAIWFVTQALLARRNNIACGEVHISDGIHNLTAKWHKKLFDNPRAANQLLILSSLVIDALGLYILGTSIFGPTMQPFLGLMVLFALRQICQAFCPLPPPPGMIWRDPGFPTLLVTYGTANDLFFSGHTALAVYGTTVLATALGPWGVAIGFAIAIFEILAVLILRAHYTMDVFTGAVTALYVHHLAWKVAPTVDQWIAHAAGWF